jgi:hypothetical protein
MQKAVNMHAAHVIASQIIKHDSFDKQECYINNEENGPQIRVSSFLIFGSNTKYVQR